MEFKTTSEFVEVKKKLTDEHAALVMEFVNNYNTLTPEQYNDLNKKIDDVRQQLKGVLHYFGV